MTTEETEKNLTGDPFINALPRVNECGLAEITSNKLNEIITYTVRERMREEEKDHPHLQYPEDMKKLRDEAARLIRHSESFATRESMTAIIKKYYSLLRELKRKANIITVSPEPEADSDSLFEISDKKFFKILHEEIIPAFTSEVTPQKEKATAIILGGQPGSGVTKLQQKALEQLQNNAVVCEVEALDDFHPATELLQQEYWDDYNNRTYSHAYAERWHAGVINYCLHNKLNFIIKTSFTDGDWLNELMAEIKAHPGIKYEVNVMLLAVDPKESWATLQQLQECQSLQRG